MNYIIISDGLEYKIAEILENHKNHYIVKTFPHYEKRKVKLEHKIYPIIANDINKFSIQVSDLIKIIDIKLLSELIDEKKYSLDELSNLYFGEKYSEIEKTALLFKLAYYWVYFNNFQNGYFSKCSLDEKNKRLEIINNQRLEQEKFDKFYQDLINNIKPAFTTNIVKLLNKPDKHSTEYKVLLHTSKELGLSQIELCYKVGLIKDLEKFFIDSFMLENFPKGLALPTTITSNNSILDSILINPTINVFSIDDSTTTEIDDAFSVQIIDSGYIIGIHIAAPALEENLAHAVAENISTIYYPGDKITMLPQDIIKRYSLCATLNCPVVSIYFTLDKEFNIISYNSTIEIVKIMANLRIEELELLFNTDNLEKNSNYQFEKELKILYKFADYLEKKRGKPSVNNLILDYNFSFIDGRVIIKPRLRGNPIDKLVSELMILANCTWGRMLTNAFIPGIYRVKQPNYPVKMTLTPNSHTGLNVDYYTWATSPLRRASDYINQKQIISLITNNKNFYKATNEILLEVVDNFDSKYAKYIDFQNKMEKYWALYYLLQEKISSIEATFIYKSKIQLENIPLEIDTQGLIVTKPKGSKILVKILNINLANLYFDFKIIDNSST